MRITRAIKHEIDKQREQTQRHVTLTTDCLCYSRPKLVITMWTYLYYGDSDRIIRKFEHSVSINHLHSYAPNVVVEYFPLLLRIREVPDSNLGPETGYPDSFLRVSSVPQGKFRGSTLN
jgi:hypothetical protein